MSIECKVVQIQRSGWITKDYTGVRLEGFDCIILFPFKTTLCLKCNQLSGIKKNLLAFQILLCYK